MNRRDFPGGSTLAAAGLTILPGGLRDIPPTTGSTSR
jgi:hypothetical protein